MDAGPDRSARRTPSGVLAALGPFFAVDIHDPRAAVRPPWRPLGELVDRPERLDARVRAVRAALAGSAGRPVDAIDPRVATSVAHLGLVARLLAPTIAAAALGSAPLAAGFAVDLGEVWWQDQLGGPFPLSVAVSAPGTVLWPGSAVDVLTTATAERFPIAPRVLWGNVASAANSAARLVAVSRPDRATAARAAADTILADPRIEDGELRSGPSFRRRSCCLIYRLSGTRDAVCGDCVLRDGPDPVAASG